jgi:Rho-binding antiterminator
VIVHKRAFRLGQDMQPSPTAYVPVACEFHDRLEDLATTCEIVSVQYKDDEGISNSTVTSIVDVYARDGAEYIALDCAEVVRLDRIEDVLTSGAMRYGRG